MRLIEAKSSLPAIQVPAHHRGELLHRLDLAAHDAGTPVQQHLSHDVDLLALENLAKLLLVDPGLCGAYTRHASDQCIEIGGGIVLEIGAKRVTFAFPYVIRAHRAVGNTHERAHTSMPSCQAGATADSN